MAADECPGKMTIEGCAQARGACRETVNALLTAEFTKISAPLSSMDEKLDELMKLFDRVRALETWKANLNGKAEEMVKAADAENDLRDAIRKAVDDSEGRIVASLKTRKSDKDGILLPRWAVIASAGLLVMIVMLAALAGERVLPYLFKVPTP